MTLTVWTHGHWPPLLLNSFLSHFQLILFSLGEGSLPLNKTTFRYCIQCQMYSMSNVNVLTSNRQLVWHQLRRCSPTTSPPPRSGWRTRKIHFHWNLKTNEKLQKKQYIIYWYVQKLFRFQRSYWQNDNILLSLNPENNYIWYNDVSFRWFQFRLLNRIIPMSKFLQQQNVAHGFKHVHSKVTLNWNNPTLFFFCHICQVESVAGIEILEVRLMMFLKAC